MAELFGFSIQRASKDVGPREKTFTDPTPDDGAIEIAGGGFFSSVLDTDGRERNDLDLIRRYISSLVYRWSPVLSQSY